MGEKFIQMGVDGKSIEKKNPYTPTLLSKEEKYRREKRKDAHRAFKKYKARLIPLTEQEKQLLKEHYGICIRD